MDLHELRVAARLIDGLAKRALFAEKQMVALEGQCAEWQRIADNLKAERNALRSTTIDTATGHLLDAFGSLANEPRLGATDDEYRDRIVTKIHTIKLERDALRAECDDLRRVFAVVHGSLGIQQGEHIGNAIEALKKERDELRAQLDTERERHKQTASILAQYAPKTMQIEPPPEATHDTPEGKQAAESAVKREPKPGDVVRLVSVPTCNDYGHAWILEWGAVGNMGKVCKIRSYPFGNVAVVDIDARLSYEWPLSCVEVVKGGDK